MNTDVKSVVEECTKGSAENRLKFPEQLKKLTEAGVEGYYADLRRSIRIYYLPTGESLEVVAAEVDVNVAEAFDAKGVETAIRQVQAGTITYKTFCEKVMVAGCSGYIVSALGRRVVYFGRTAETHVELLPAAK
jgi:uncharacterized protein YbcV (DUF1398 family)